MEDIHDEVANLRTNLSSLQSVTNSLGTYSLISLSRYCSSNFCRSSESTEHLLKVDLKVLPANDNPQTPVLGLSSVLPCWWRHTFNCCSQLIYPYTVATSCCIAPARCIVTAPLHSSLLKCGIAASNMQ